jgi:alkanesulfonate monooxygenase SsuD/methylene tetrahydromethanopterin reductase-like flavin-dependent oxidoreductase (luciferase family)
VEGTIHSVDGAYNVPQPVRPGGPPIMIGGGGEKKTLRLVARYADMWNGFGTEEDIRHKLDVIEQHCADVGRDPKEITTTRLGTLIITDTHEEAEAILDEVKRLRGLDDAAARASMISGTADEVAERIQRFFDVGLDGMLFNLPKGSTPEDVERAGTTLTERFGARPAPPA